MNRILLAAVVILGILTALLVAGPLRSDQNSPNNSSEQTTTIVMNAFHWGWVPEIDQTAPGVRVEIGPGAQGSQIIAPQGTELRLVLRNAAALPELHNSLEERFEAFFVEKYGDAWRNIHEASHEADEDHGDEHSEESSPDEDENSIMTHAFYLEGFDVQIELSHEHGSHEQIVHLKLDKAGEFRFMCINYCGIGHGDMQGTLVVESGS